MGTILTFTESVDESAESASMERSAPDPDLDRLRSRAQSGERLSVDFQTRRAHRLDATSQRLRRINARHSDIELAEDDVAIFRDYAVHDAAPHSAMRRPLTFTESALEKFAEDFREGRTMNVHHDGERQIGATFDAGVREDEVDGVAANWLVVDWYAPLIDASESRLQDINDVRTGVLRHTSIEFAGGEWEMKEGPNKDSHYVISDNPSAGMDRLEAEGIARVSLGAVRGAGSAG